MAETVEIQMPQMGESVTEGTVLEWLKHEGEFVSEGETVVEVSTDKIDAEVPAPASGVITRILKGPDETIEVGGVLAELDPTAEPSADGASGNGAAASAGGDREPGPGLTAGATGEGDADLGDESAPSEAAQPGATKTVTPTESAEPGESVQITMPEMGESVTEGTVLEWHVAEGQSVSEGDTVIEVSTDKIDAEVPAPSSGVITKLLVSADDTVQVG
ncbi:MAG TPA: biotin/lipoyl-containing protein, partial [Solirubrobacterales bacterium]|nr:biotin/lipoyl-containing protein [Solirubrobacterales bacterium]